jgi:hypothetical protein
MKIILADKSDTKFLAFLLAAVMGCGVNDIEILDVKIEKKFLFDRHIYLDILAKVEGALINFEVQLTYQKYFDLRCFWQLSAIFQNNANMVHQDMKKSGLTRISHDEFFEKLPKTVSISFCGFNIDKDDPDYIWRFGLVDLERMDRRMVPEVEFYLIELPKFKKLFDNTDAADLKTPLEKWLYFFVMCDTKEKLERFLDLNEDIFKEYENKIERVSQMLDFLDRYTMNMYDLVEFMTPAEELEYFKTKLTDKDKALEDKDKEMVQLRNELAKFKPAI